MIRFTLVTDGSSDQVLTRIIDWALWECGVRSELISQWADLRRLRIKPQGLTNVISKALELYPCDLLFVHRDAENETRQHRVDEIKNAITHIDPPPCVALVPIRMQESWLLCDEDAIRMAAGNPNGKVALRMPRTSAIENLSDPKESVFSLLRTASGRSGRRLQQFNVEFARTMICQHLNGFDKLRALGSFRAFEADLREVIQQHHFNEWH